MKDNKKKIDWNNYKIDILTLKKANALVDIKLDDDYFDIMQNEWLLDKYISRLGITSEEDPCESLTAIDKAIDLGYAINLVVQGLKDDTIICFKHKSLGEMTGLNAYVSNVTYDDIKDLVIKNTKHHIITLEDMLDHIAGRAPITIEILNEAFVGKIEGKIEQLLDKYCSKYNQCGKVAIMSINPLSLEWFYENAPWYTRILKSGNFKDIKSYANIKVSKLRKLKYLKVAKADFVAYIAKDIPSKYLKRKNVVGILAYNVMSQEEYKRVMPYIDNIVFTNFIPEV
ncbi:MAG: hypothetical protein E7361_01420 [Clostridiales bacterium]|nr:hypothetical protein [Clostridiales bacterium]